MKAIHEHLSGLGDDAIQRVLAWAHSAFNQEPPRTSLAGDLSAIQMDLASDPNESIADLFAHAAPESGPECALVVGYYLQAIEKQPEFEGRAINDALKQLGRPLANVTATLSGLMLQKPQLVMQTQKIGRGTQGKKRYKLTVPGIQQVRRMLGLPESGSTTEMR